MFFQLLYIHLFRPFLKYSQQTSPLPPNVSPRRLCTQAAAMVSKLMRLYKRSHGLRQICNIAVYILHTACTIHLLNLPDKNARRDITHGLKHLEEIAESWLCARRTLAILHILAKKWNVDLPEEALGVLQRTDSKYGAWGVEAPKTPSPSHNSESMSPVSSPTHTIVQPPPNYFIPQNSVSVPIGMNRRSSIHTPLPPQTVAEMQSRVLQPSPAHTTTQNTPASRNSLDSGITAPGGSPSALFGGVDQLLRDSQDWWLRDQSQLAMGFEQWPSAETEWMHPVSSPTIATNGLGYAGQGGVNGYVNGMANANGSANGNGSGLHGFGSGIHQYPSEHEWYS